MKLINNTGGATAEITRIAGGKRVFTDVGEMSTVMNRVVGNNNNMAHVEVQASLDDGGSIQWYGTHELDGYWYDGSQHEFYVNRIGSPAWTNMMSKSGIKTMSLRLFRLPEIAESTWVGMGEMAGENSGAVAVWQTDTHMQIGALQGEPANWKMQVAEIIPTPKASVFGHTINNQGASVDAIAPNKFVEIDRWFSRAAGSRNITLDPRFKEIEVHQWCASGASTYIISTSGLTLDGMYRDANFSTWNVAQTTAWVKINPAHLGNTHCRYRWFPSYNGWECDMTFIRRNYTSKALLHVPGDSPVVGFGNEQGNTRPTFIHAMGVT